MVFILWRFGDLDVAKYLLLKILCFCGFCFTAKFCLTDALLLPISDTVKSYSEIHKLHYHNHVFKLRFIDTVLSNDFFPKSILKNRFFNSLH